MEMVNLKINGMPISVPQGTTILEAARSADIRAFAGECGD